MTLPSGHPACGQTDGCRHPGCNTPSRGRACHDVGDPGGPSRGRQVNIDSHHEALARTPSPTAWPMESGGEGSVRPDLSLEAPQEVLSVGASSGPTLRPAEGEHDRAGRGGRQSTGRTWSPRPGALHALSWEPPSPGQAQSWVAKAHAVCGKHGVWMFVVTGANPHKVSPILGRVRQGAARSGRPPGGHLPPAKRRMHRGRGCARR